MFNLPEKLAGEQAIARAVLLVLPLIDRHFKPFDGKRAHIQTGRSAAFQKVVAAFREEAEAQTEVQVFIHDQYQAVSARVKLSQPDPDNHNGGCIYYSADVYFGEWDNGAWNHSPTGEYKHTYTPERVAAKEAECEQVLATTVDELEIAIKRTESLQKQQDRIKQGVAACFRVVLEK